MNQAEAAALQNAISSMNESVIGAFNSSMILRVEVHIRLALMNGAEDEDIPKVMEQAISTGYESLLESMKELSCSEQAKTIVKNRFK